MRLIDADELLNKLNRLDLDYGAMGGVAECLDRIEEAPTIEPSGDIVSRQLLIGAIEKCGEEKIYPQALIQTIKALPSAEQVTSKLKNPCNSLLADDVEECKEQKSKLDLISREEAIEIIASHDETNGTEKVFTGREITDLLATLPSADRPNVAYICDGRKCDNDCSECLRTLDIEHARDFKLLGDTYYQQEQADRPKGEWHKTESEEMEITGYYCSVCDMPTDQPTNYCGYCGADMREK